MTRKAPRSFTGDVAVNVLFALIPIAVTLVSVPIYLSLIGLERYGILTLVWALTGMFAFFDFGMGSATNYLVARARGGADGPSAGSVILTNGLVNFVLGWLFALIFWLWVGPLVFGNIKGSPGFEDEIQDALFWISLLLPVGFVSSIFRNALDGQRRFLTGNLIGVSGQVATVLGAIAVAQFVGPELVNLVIAVLVVRLLVLGLFMWSGRATLQHSNLMRLKDFAGVAKFGGWQTLFSALTGVLSSADRFIIGWVVGASATALYAIPNSIMSRLGFLSQSILRTLYPRFAEVLDDENRQDLGARALFGTMAVIAIIIVPAILFVRPFFGIWLGPEFETTAGPIAQVLLIALFLQSCLRVLFVLQRASGRPDIAAKLRLVTILPSVAVMVAMVWWFGAIGAALALLARFVTEVLWMLYLSKLIGRALAPIAGFLVLCAGAILLSTVGFDPVTAGVLAALTAVLLTGLALALSEDLRRVLARFLPLRSRKGGA